MQKSNIINFAFEKKCSDVCVETEVSAVRVVTVTRCAFSRQVGRGSEADLKMESVGHGILCCV